MTRNRLAWLVTGIAFMLTSLLEEDLLRAPETSDDRWMYFFIAVACLSLPLLASHITLGTILSVGAVVGLLVVEHSLPGGAQLAAILALYMAGSKLPRPSAHRVRLGVLIPFSVTYLYFLVEGRNELSDVVIFLGFATAVYFVGDITYKKDLAEQRLAAQNVLLIEQRELRTQQAVTEERSRIGRELHDILAHTVSLMVIQAGAARKVLRADIDQADGALDAIESSGRNALRDMRSIVSRMGSDSPTDLSPTPGISTLTELFEVTEAAGLPVTSDIAPRTHEISEPLQLTVYRIVQESLTNALKHAGSGATASVKVWVDGQALCVRVHNTIGTEPPLTIATGGHGLTGMAERVHVFGGTLEAGETDDGFTVTAQLPFQTARS